jgi:hypothetical protein
MPKQSKKRRVREELTLYLVHCECVRRNPRYAEEYPRRSEHPFGADIAQTWFASEWGLLPGDELPNPTDRPPLEQALSRAIPRELGLPYRPGSLVPDRRVMDALMGARFSDIVADRTRAAGMLLLVYFPEEDFERPTLSVFDARWSKRDLLEGCEAWIDQAITKRKSSGLQQERPAQRLRLSEYPDYLRVYDLRSGGKTFKEIATALWADRAGDLEKRARDYYLRGEALVLNPPRLPKRKPALRSKNPSDRDAPDR